MRHFLQGSMALAAAWILVSSLALGDEPASIGFVVVVRGNVEAISSGGAVRQLKQKDPIYKEDTIKTGAGARIQLSFIDNTVISLGQSTEVKLAQYEYDPAKRDGKMTTTVKEGIFRVMGGAITKVAPDKFKTETPTATIGIRGSLFAGEQRGSTLRVIFIGGRGITVSNAAGIVRMNVPSSGTIVLSPVTPPTAPSAVVGQAMTAIVEGSGSGGDGQTAAAPGEVAAGEGGAPAEPGAGTAGQAMDQTAGTVIASSNQNVITDKVVADNPVYWTGIGYAVGYSEKTFGASGPPYRFLYTTGATVSVKMDESTGSASSDVTIPEMGTGTPILTGAGADFGSAYKLSSYVTKGEWTASYNDPIFSTETYLVQSSNAFWIAGQVTSSSYIQGLIDASQTGTYSGVASCIYVSGAVAQSFAGTSDISVSFGPGPGSFSGSLIFPSVSVLMSGTVSSAGISGSVYDVNGSAPNTSDVTGKFCGPGAENLIGAFNATTGAGDTILGGFGATGVVGGPEP